LHAPIRYDSVLMPNTEWEEESSTAMVRGPQFASGLTQTSKVLELGNDKFWKIVLDK